MVNFRVYQFEKWWCINMRSLLVAITSYCDSTIFFNWWSDYPTIRLIEIIFFRRLRRIESGQCFIEKALNRQMIISSHRPVQIRWLPSLWSIGWNCRWKKNRHSSGLFKTVPLIQNWFRRHPSRACEDTTFVPKHQRDFVWKSICVNTSYSEHRTQNTTSADSNCAD